MKNLFSVATILLAIGFGLIPANRVLAQNFTVLHSFTARPEGTNYDGSYPVGKLTGDSSCNTLYGTANLGGQGFGTVFAVNPDGSGFTNRHHFNHCDGGGPNTLVLVGNSLFGVARDDGNFDNGTMCRLSFAPQLNIHSSEANVTLTWPTHVAGFDYTGFTLKSTANLSLPTSWSPVAQPAETNGNQIAVSVPATKGNNFFRLQSQ